MFLFVLDAVNGARSVALPLAAELVWLAFEEQQAAVQRSMKWLRVFLWGCVCGAVFTQGAWPCVLDSRPAAG